MNNSGSVRLHDFDSRSLLELYSHEYKKELPQLSGNS